MLRITSVCISKRLNAFRVEQRVSLRHGDVVGGRIRRCGRMVRKHEEC